MQRQVRALQTKKFHLNHRRLAVEHQGDLMCDPKGFEELMLCIPFAMVAAETYLTRQERVRSCFCERGQMFVLPGHSCAYFVATVVGQLCFVKVSPGRVMCRHATVLFAIAHPEQETHPADSLVVVIVFEAVNVVIVPVGRVCRNCEMDDSLAQFGQTQGLDLSPSVYG